MFFWPWVACRNCWASGVGEGAGEPGDKAADGHVGEAAHDGWVKLHCHRVGEPVHAGQREHCCCLSGRGKRQADIQGRKLGAVRTDRLPSQREPGTPLGLQHVSGPCPSRASTAASPASSARPVMPAAYAYSEALSRKESGAKRCSWRRAASKLTCSRIWSQTNTVPLIPPSPLSYARQEEGPQVPAGPAGGLAGDGLGERPVAGGPLHLQCQGGRGVSLVVWAMSVGLAQAGPWVLCRCLTGNRPAPGR